MPSKRPRNRNLLARMLARTHVSVDSSDSPILPLAPSFGKLGNLLPDRSFIELKVGFSNPAPDAFHADTAERAPR